MKQWTYLDSITLNFIDPKLILNLKNIPTILG